MSIQGLATSPHSYYTLTALGSVSEQLNTPDTKNSILVNLLLKCGNINMIKFHQNSSLLTIDHQTYFKSHQISQTC